MNEHVEPQNISNDVPDEPEMLALIKKMQRHLIFLEKKIDTLIEGQSRKPFNEKRFSKPGHSGGNFRRRVETKGGYRSSTSGSGSGRNFGRSNSFAPSRDGQDRGNRHSPGKKRPFRHKKERH